MGMAQSCEFRGQLLEDGGKKPTWRACCSNAQHQKLSKFGRDGSSDILQVSEALGGVSAGVSVVGQSANHSWQVPALLKLLAKSLSKAGLTFGSGAPNFFGPNPA